ncbi:MAG TPA: hypothetical protein VM513_23420 [Kofleriaceae bacterium]|nr:hypothetical protein [Kofleriaceae bacterium]
MQRVGDVIARGPRPHSPDVVDGSPVPVFAEGTAPVAMPEQMTNPPRRRLWPWAAGTAVVAMVGTLGSWQYSKRAHRAELEARYPVVATTAEQVVLDREVDRWRTGRERLLANLAAFDAPDLATMAGVGECAHAKATSGDAAIDDVNDLDPDATIATRMVLLPGEQLEGLDVSARIEIDAMLAAAERGRFRTVAARDHVLASLGGAFVVARLHTYSSGIAAGTAYAFDPATGTLRCAGAFHTQADPASTERAILGALRAVSGTL